MVSYFHENLNKRIGKKIGAVAQTVHGCLQLSATQAILTSGFQNNINRGVRPYSLGGGVPLGSRKSYSLLDQILQILWPYTRPKLRNCS